jgi:hypothetical protein
VAEHFFRHPGVGIGVFAKTKHFLFAVKTLSARNGKRDHHAVANFPILQVTAGFYDFAHELVSEDVALLHSRYESVVKVEIRTANRRGANLHNSVSAI